jgi:hypothetical protein
MTNLYSPLAVAAFLGVIIAVHVIYFHARFPGDSRLRIKLALKAGAHHAENFPAVLRRLPFLLPDAERSAVRLVIEQSPLVLEGPVVDTALVCCGNVEIRPGAVICSSIKVRGNLDVGANVTFLGPVVVNGNIRTEENCHFLFEVVTRGRLAAGKGTLFAWMNDELLRPMAGRELLVDPARPAQIMLSV